MCHSTDLKIKLHHSYFKHSNSRINRNEMKLDICLSINIEIFLALKVIVKKYKLI